MFVMMIHPTQFEVFFKSFDCFVSNKMVTKLKH
jgi:hypothetical protein